MPAAGGRGAGGGGRGGRRGGGGGGAPPAPPHQADWLAVVRAQVAAGGTVVSVLHELNMALAADDIVVLRAGRLLHHGPAACAHTHAALRAAFDGRISIRQLERQWVALPQADRSEPDHAD